MPEFQRKGIEKSRPVIESLQQLATKYNATPSQVALNWVINYHGDTVIAIPGATKVSYAKENAGAMKFILSEDDMRLLDEVSRDFR